VLRLSPPDSIAKIAAFIRCGVVLAISLAAQSGYGGNTALVMDSPTGDWVGAGQSWYYTAPTASFTASRNNHNGVSFSIHLDSECWLVDFSAPGMAPLTVGNYPHVSRYPFEGEPFQGPYDAGLSIQGGRDCSAGHGCSTLSGSFVVTELVWAGNGSLISFHASFSQACELHMPLLRGEIFFNSEAVLPPPHHVTSPAIAYSTEGQPFTYRITASKPEFSYSTSGLPGGLTLNAITGLISGIAEEHGQFDVMLTATGQAGSTTAILHLGVDPPGRSTGPFTAMRLTSEMGDYIGQGHDASAAAGDGTFVGYTGGPTMDISFRPWALFTNNDWSGYLYLRLDGHGGVLSPGAYVDPDPNWNGSGTHLFAEIGMTGPSDSTGSFNIREISADPNHRLEHFRASFVQFANRGPSALRGWVWYNAENVITSWPFAFGKQGRPFTYQIVANNEPTSYNCAGLPLGLSLDPQSGRITGIPTVFGVYDVTLNAIGPTAIASEALRLKINPAQTLANISTRVKVGVGNSSLIGGFIVAGRDNKKVIIRAIGPSLSGSGLNNALSDPVLDLRNDSGGLIASNDDWRSRQGEVEATGLPPTDDRESAMVAVLVPGNYTAIVTGKNGAVGLGLVEVYDIDSAANAQLANISTRGSVESGDNVLIGGFIVGFGNSQAQSRILFRAIGPALLYGGIPNYLSDPVMDLYNADGAIIASNDNWRDSQQTEIEATGIAPEWPAESAILVTLPAGRYTAIVRGKNNGTGIGLVEAYQVDN
jgi:hypothetical protein